MIDLFYNINDENKIKLLRFLEADIFNFKKNTTILSTLKGNNIIGFIESGYVQIIRTDYNGGRTIIEELEENSIFGSIISSISNNDYDIVTKEDTKMIIIEYNKIINSNDNNFESYNQFIKNLFQITTNQTLEKNERINILTKKTIRNKLLEYFNIISKKHGSKNVYLPFSFTDLADYLAVDRSAMSRELGYLKSEGFIEIKGRRITLLYKHQIDKGY